MVTDLDAMDYLLDLEDMVDHLKEKLTLKEFNAFQDRINEIKKYVRNSQNIIVPVVKG